MRTHRTHTCPPGLRSALAGAAIVLAASPPGTARAQEPPVPLESRVRATVDSAGDEDRLRYVGRLQAWNGTTARIDEERLGLTTIPLSGLTKLEVSEGERSHTLAGTLIGVATGALIGVAIAANTDTYYCWWLWPISIGSGALVGGAAGAIIGKNVTSEAWEPVTVRRVPAPATAAPQPR